MKIKYQPITEWRQTAVINDNEIKTYQFSKIYKNENATVTLENSPIEGYKTYVLDDVDLVSNIPGTGLTTDTPIEGMGKNRVDGLSNLIVRQIGQENTIEHVRFNFGEENTLPFEIMDDTSVVRCPYGIWLFNLSTANNPINLCSVPFSESQVYVVTKMDTNLHIQLDCKLLVYSNSIRMKRAMMSNHYYCRHIHFPQPPATTHAQLLLYSSGRMYVAGKKYESNPKPDNEVFPFLVERNSEKVEDFEYSYAAVLGMRSQPEGSRTPATQ